MVELLGSQMDVPVTPALSPAFAEAASRRQAPGERAKGAISKLIEKTCCEENLRHELCRTTPLACLCGREKIAKEG